ncbi:MAG: hypothetical protein JXA54_04335 [Candidatus Heimdallarchaeota archaeon]|nr:hypothetical protein [Candidatus Heimdallarchaeota archaeon]
MLLKRLAELRKNGFLILFRIYLKSNKKRFILTILTTSLIFILFSSLTIVWFNYRELAFQEYLNKSNWYNDDSISTYQSIPTSRANPNYTITDINNLIDSMDIALKGIEPNLFLNNYVWLYAFQVYENRYNPILNNAYGYYTFSDVILNLIQNNLAAGRMPINPNEVLFYSEYDSLKTFEINDTLNLNTAGTNFPISIQNITVVGIITNLDNILYQAGYSADIPHWEKYIDTEEFDEFIISGKFITSKDFFFEFINNFPYVSSKKGISFEINYNHSNLESRKISQYLTYLSNFHGSWNKFSPFLDLANRLNSYNDYWLQETNRIILLNLPIIFLIFILIVDISNIDKRILEQSLYLLKKQGVNNKRIRKVILLEKSIYVFCSIILGILIGIIISTLILVITLRPVITMNIFDSLSEPLFIFPTLILILALIFGSFFHENNLLKKFDLSKSEMFKKRRSIRLRKLFGYLEVILLIPGSICIGIGFLGLFLSKVGYWTPLITYFTTILFVSMIYFGVMLLGIIIFLMVSKLIEKFWHFFGKRFRFLKKNLFTFSMKNFSMNYSPYRIIVIALMISSIAIIPGLMLNIYYPKHIELEAELRTGFSDIVITDWQSNQTIREEIMNLDSIKCSAEVSRYFFELKINPPLYTRIQVLILGIDNTTEFIQTTNSNNFIDYIGCSLDDIGSLESIDSYLMDYDYSKKNRYDKDEILYNNDFISVNYNQFPLYYIASFKAFPLMRLPERNILFENNIIQFNLVTSMSTLNHLKNAALEEPLKEENFLLVKTESTANLSEVKEQILQDVNLNAFSKEDFIEEISYPFTFWKQKIAIIDVIITITILCLICYFLARNVYQQKIKIIESSFRVGASKKQLLSSLLIEFSIASFLPLFISIAFGLGLLPMILPLLFNFPIPYTNFSWQGNWLIIFVLVPLVLPLLFTYYIGLFPLVKRYKLIKEE